MFSLNPYVNDFTIHKLISSLLFSVPQESSDICKLTSYRKWKHQNSDLEPFIPERTLTRQSTTLPKIFSTNQSSQTIASLFSNSKSPLHVTCFYLRLESYLSVLPCTCAKPLIHLKPTTDSDDPLSKEYLDWLKSINMTCNFYPLFIGLLSSRISNQSNWKTYKKNVLDHALNIFEVYKKPSCPTLPLEIETNENLYSYWLNLVFPNEMYESLKKIDTYIKKNRSFSPKDYICENLLYLVHRISNTYFISLSLQTDFYMEFLPCLSEFIETNSFHFHGYLVEKDISDFYSSLLEVYKNREEIQYNDFTQTPLNNMEVSELLSLIST